MECPTTKKGTLAFRFASGLDAHVSTAGGLASQEQTLKLPTGEFIPDMVAWVQRPTDQQQESIALTPFPNLWVEVCYLLYLVKLLITLLDLLQ